MPTFRLDANAFRSTVNRFADRNARATAKEVERLAKRYAPVETGRLRASIRTERKWTLRGPGYTVGSPLDYAWYVEDGTRPHDIRPKQAAALRFTVGGRVVFAKLVHHPGTKPVKFLARATREAAIRNGYNVRITE